MTHTFSVKVGGEFGAWQYRFKDSHDKLLMEGMQHILNKTCQLLGFDYNEGLRSAAGTHADERETDAALVRHLLAALLPH